MKAFILLTIILLFVFVMPVKSNYLEEDHYTLIKKINDIDQKMKEIEIIHSEMLHLISLEEIIGMNR